MKPVKKHHVAKGHTAFVVSMSPHRYPPFPKRPAHGSFLFFGAGS
jgi:hypothetical protein